MNLAQKTVSLLRSAITMHPNTNEDASPDATTIDLGLWLGRQQAFSLVASKCSAGQAECLKQFELRGVSIVTCTSTSENRSSH